MTALLLIAVAILIWKNSQLQKAVAALTDQQNGINTRLDRLSKTSRKQTSKQRKYERKLEQQRKKQARLAKQQEQIKKEQTRQRETLSKLQFKMQLAESDIAAAQDRLISLFAILDCVKNQQAGTVPGSPADIRLARQAVVLESQIATAERKLAKAQFDRSQAADAMAA